VVYFLLTSSLKLLCALLFAAAAWSSLSRADPGPRSLARLRAWVRARGSWSLIVLSPLTFWLDQTGLLLLAVWWGVDAVLRARADRARGEQVGSAARDQMQWAVGSFLLSLIFNFFPIL